MLRHFETTVFILFWCAALSIVWALASYHRLHAIPRPGAGRSLHPVSILLPALVMVPLLVRSAHSLFGVSLFYPVHMLTTLADVFVRALIPAIVLLLASGLLVQLSSRVRGEYAFWHEMPFSRVIEAFGRSPKRELRLLVLAKALIDAWQQALPWLFGELIVVEALFNAPGLAGELWRAARVHNWQSLVEHSLSLMLIYFILVEVAQFVSRSVGRRLSGYV